MINRMFGRVSALAEALSDSEQGGRVLETVSRRGFAVVIALAAFTGMARANPTPSSPVAKLSGCGDCEENGDCGSGCEPDEGDCPDLPFGSPPGAHCWCAKESEEDWKLVCDCVCGGTRCVCEAVGSDNCESD